MNIFLRFKKTIFLVLILALAAALAALTYFLPQKNIDIGNGLLKKEISTQPEFRVWISKWRETIPDLSESEFTVKSDGPIKTYYPQELARKLSETETKPPITNRYIFSPDKKRFVDYLANFGEPDSSFGIFNRDGKNLLEVLKFCGTSCVFDGAFWISNNSFVVTGNTKTNIFIYYYDLANNREIDYVSNTRAIGENPFEAQNKEKWENGKQN